MDRLMYTKGSQRAGVLNIEFCEEVTSSWVVVR